MYKKIAIVALAMFALTACAGSQSMQSDAKSAMAKPAKGKLFKVYYPSGGTGPDAQGKAVIRQAVALAKQFDSPRVVVSGYTDRAGSSTSNEKLSLKRAQRVAAALVLEGVSETSVKLHGYGERFPDVATRDGVVEPKNRRVEIQVAP